MFVHVSWAGLLYVLLTIMRAPSIWNIGAREDGTNPWAELEPRTSANLSNQFEWPLFFYIVCILVLLNDRISEEPYIWLAWTFVIGRILHSFVQILTRNIRLRGIVFTINFVAVFGMWAALLVDYLG
ncbi:MAG: MAPEG family protein [Gammaproteobacteria bacterium]